MFSSTGILTATIWIHQQKTNTLNRCSLVPSFVRCHTICVVWYDIMPSIRYHTIIITHHTRNKHRSFTCTHAYTGDAYIFHVFLSHVSPMMIWCLSCVFTFFRVTWCIICLFFLFEYVCTCGTFVTNTAAIGRVLVDSYGGVFYGGFRHAGGVCRDDNRCGNARGQRVDEGVLRAFSRPRGRSHVREAHRIRGIHTCTGTFLWIGVTWSHPIYLSVVYSYLCGATRTYVLCNDACVRSARLPPCDRHDIVVCSRVSASTPS